MNGFRTARQLVPSMRRMSSIPEQHARPVPERNGAAVFAERLFRRYLTGSEADYPEALLVFREQEEQALQQAAGEVKLTQLIFQTLLQLNEYLLPSSGENRTAFSLLVRNAENILKVIRTGEAHQIGTKLLREITLLRNGAAGTEETIIEATEKRGELLMERLILAEQAQVTIEKTWEKFREESVRLGFPVKKESLFLEGNREQMSAAVLTGSVVHREVGKTAYPVETVAGRGTGSSVGIVTDGGTLSASGIVAGRDAGSSIGNVVDRNTVSSMETATNGGTVLTLNFRRLMEQGRRQGWRISFHRQNPVVFSQRKEEWRFLQQKNQLTTYLMELSGDEQRTVWQTILQKMPSLVQREPVEQMPQAVTEQLTELVEQSSRAHYRELVRTVFLWAQSQGKKQLSTEQQRSGEPVFQRTERLEQVTPALRLIRKFLQGGNTGREAWRETLAKIPSKATVALHQLVEESGLFQVEGTGKKSGKRYQRGSDVPTLFTGNRESFLRLQRFLQWTETQRWEMLLQKSEQTEQTQILTLEKMLHEVREAETVTARQKTFLAQRSTLTLLSFLTQRQEEHRKHFAGLLPQKVGSGSGWTPGKADLLSQTAITGAKNRAAFPSQKGVAPGSYEEPAFVLHLAKAQEEAETLPISDWVADIRKITKELIAAEISGSGYEKARGYMGRKHVSKAGIGFQDATGASGETQSLDAVTERPLQQRSSPHSGVDMLIGSGTQRPLAASPLDFQRKKAAVSLSLGEAIWRQTAKTALTVWENQETSLLHSVLRSTLTETAEERSLSRTEKTAVARLEKQLTVIREQIKQQQIFDGKRNFRKEPDVFIPDVGDRLGLRSRGAGDKRARLVQELTRDFAGKIIRISPNSYRIIQKSAATMGVLPQQVDEDHEKQLLLETARIHRLMEQPDVDVQQEAETVFKQKLKKLFSRVVVQDRETTPGAKAENRFQEQKPNSSGLLPMLQQFRASFMAQKILQKESVLRDRQEENLVSGMEKLSSGQSLSYKETVQRQHLQEDVFSQSATEKLLSRLETIHEIRQVRRERQGQEAEKQKLSKAPNQGKPPSTTTEVLAVLHKRGQEVSQFLPVFRRSDWMPEDFAQRSNPEKMTFASRNRLSSSAETEEKWKLLEKRLSEQVVSHSSSVFLQSIGTEHPLSLRQNITTFSKMEQGRNSNVAIFNGHTAAIGGQERILSSQATVPNKAQEKAEKALVNVTELVQKFSAPPPFKETLGEAVKTVLQSERLMENRTFAYEREQELEFRRETPETAELVNDTVLTEQTVKHSAELRLLSGKTGEQEKLLSVQQETIEGLQSRLKEQEAVVKKALENRQSTGSTEPGEVRRIAKAVMQELEEKIKLERQRRGMF